MIKEPRVLIVGERINTSRKNIRKAVEERNHRSDFGVFRSDCGLKVRECSHDNLLGSEY